MSEMVKEQDLVLIFNSVHRVMKAERVLKDVDAPILLIPVPRQLSSDCGLAIRVASTGLTDVLRILREAELEPLEIYRKATDGYFLETS